MPPRPPASWPRPSQGIAWWSRSNCSTSTWAIRSRRGSKSLAFRVYYRSADRTLTDRDVEKARRGIVRRLESQFNAPHFAIPRNPLNNWCCRLSGDPPSAFSSFPRRGGKRGSELFKAFLGLPQRLRFLFCCLLVSLVSDMCPQIWHSRVESAKLEHEDERHGRNRS